MSIKKMDSRLQELEASDWRKSATGSGHFERAEFLLETGLWSDVTFFVGEARQEFKAHKFILRTGSKVFHEMFIPDETQEEFDIKSWEPTEFGLMLRFLYTGEAIKNCEDALPLQNLASAFEIANLGRLCNDLRVETMASLPSQDSPVVALKIYQQALKYGDQEMQESAMKTICGFGNEIIKSPEFLGIGKQELANILARDDLQVPSEIKLFDAVVNWARVECRRTMTAKTSKYLRSILESVILLIRFPLMDSTDFGLKVVPTNILSLEEAIPVLVYFGVKKDQRSTISTGIFNSKPRVPYVPKGPALVLSRLQKSDEVSVDLSTNVSTGYRYIPPTALEHSIRLKSSVPIWVTSIGMNSTNAAAAGSTTDIISVQIQVKDDDKKVLSSKAVTLDGVRARTTGVHHITFDDAVHLAPDEWYSVTFTVTTGNFYADNFKAADGVGTSLDFKLTDGSDTAIKFGFRNDENLKYTGVTQGFIPEIGFKVE